jgi:hypothetical protein
MFFSSWAKVFSAVVSSQKKLRSEFSMVFCNGGGDLLFFFAELAAIAGGLDVEPEPRALFEEFHELQRHLGRDAGHVATACSLTSSRNQTGQFH